MLHLQLAEKELQWVGPDTDKLEFDETEPIGFSEEPGVSRSN